MSASSKTEYIINVPNLNKYKSNKQLESSKDSNLSDDEDQDESDTSRTVCLSTVSGAVDQESECDKSKKTNRSSSNENSDKNKLGKSDILKKISVDEKDSKRPDPKSKMLIKLSHYKNICKANQGQHFETMHAFPSSDVRFSQENHFSLDGFNEVEKNKVLNKKIDKNQIETVKIEKY